MPKVFLNLGRTGDLVLLSPVWKHIHATTGEKPIVIVSKAYEGVLSGMSYITPEVLDVDWFDGFEQAHRFAKAKYGDVCVTQCVGKNWKADTLGCQTFGETMWAIAGYKDQYGTLPMVFDNRDKHREERLMSRFNRVRPMLLYNFTGVSSPFGYTREIYAALTRVSRDFTLIDIGKIHAERFYDLLALYESAVGLVTIDTATLHLAAASKIPYLAYTVDGWNSAKPQGDNCKIAVPYSQAHRKINLVHDFVHHLPRDTKFPRNMMVRGGKRPQEIIIRRTGAIGDVLCATVVAKRIKELGHRVVFQCHPDIHCVLRRCPDVDEVRVVSGACTVNLDGAYERHGGRRQLHFHHMFYRAANEQLRRMRVEMGFPYNCKPTLKRTHDDNLNVADKFRNHPPRPWIFVVPRSDSWIVRTVPDSIWCSAAGKLPGTKFWMGRHPSPGAPFVDLGCRHLDSLISWIGAADLLLTVDTGPMHIASALGVPVIVVTQSSRPELHLNDQNDFISVSPDLNCLGCMEHVCPKNKHVPPCQNISPDVIVAAANRRMWGVGKISAVVPIYQPKVEILNKCLNSLLNQVDEIVVACEGRSIVPLGILQHSKIRVVKTPNQGIGFSGNANHGARHTVGEWILFCNDDAFLDEHAVARMREVAKPDTGIVCNLLRYPNGEIYHAGKVRSPGMRGWGHIDHKKRTHTFKNVTELENCCGCVVLTRRSVFYRAGCYDEEMKIFAQDDAYALSVRRLGYKILFTPHSTGVHLEHSSVGKVGNIMQHVNEANKVFGRRWSRYFDWNLNRIPGNFDYEKTT